MADKRMRRRRRRAPVEDEPQEEAAVAVAEPEEEPEVVEEPDPPEPEPEKEAEPPKPEKAEKVAAPTRQREKQAAPKPNVKEAPIVKAEEDPFIPEFNAREVFNGLWDGMRDGEPIVLTRTGAETVTITTGSNFVAARTRKKNLPRGNPPGYMDAILTKDYVEWLEDWSGMNDEEKIAYAEDEKIKWDKHKDHRINMMRVAVAVQNALGVKKFKEGLEAPSARKELKAEMWAQAQAAA